MIVSLVETADRRPAELLRAAGMNVVSISAGDLAALAAPATRQPDVVLVDVRGASSIPPAIAAVRRQHPDTAVVILASALDPALLLEAMRAGVNEVVAEPFEAEDLESALTRVAEQAPAGETGRIFGFVGAKGGVGTTTVAVNMAASFGAISKPARTLLIDLHQSGGDAAVFTGSEPRFSIADALANTHRLDQSFFRGLVTQVAPHTDLLASSDRGAPVQVDTEKMRRLLSFAATAYKYVVVDLPRSDGAVLDALEQLQGIFIVANQELATVKSASRLATMLRQRYGRDRVHVVLSRSDRQADIGHADVEKAVGSSVAHTFPSDYRLALQALNKGRPVALDNHNDLSASFKRFAHQLAGVRPERQAARSSGLFGRFSNKRS